MLAAMPTAVALGRCVTTPRTRLQLHYQLVGLLLAAGDDGIPLHMLSRALYSPGSLSGKLARNATLRLIDAATGALPLWQTTDNGRVVVGIRCDMLPAWLAKYGIGDAP